MKEATVKQSQGPFVLPWPPTVNTMYAHTRSGVRLTDKAINFRNTAGWEAKAQGGRVYDGRLRVRLRLYQPTEWGDIDNPIKAIFDAMNHILWNDDSQIREMMATLEQDMHNPRVELVVDEMEA